MLAIEPNAGPAPIVHIIDQARQQVDVGVYYLSDRPILRALAAAHARGVDVRVIIEGKPYGMKPWQVKKEERAIEATGATLHLAPSRFTSQADRYAFYHAKYICNGHKCEISTANFDWSAFHRNREYLYATSNGTLVKAVHAVFAADWSNQRAPSWVHKVLVLSPGTSAAQLLQAIDQPGVVDVESEELGPDKPILEAMASKGSDLRLILPASASAEDERNIEYLRSHGCQVRLLPKKPVYMHAKMIVGNRLAFIGSENFTQTSLESNREIGLLLGGSTISKLQAQFTQDWAQAAEGSPGSTLVSKAKRWFSRF